MASHSMVVCGGLRLECCGRVWCDNRRVIAGKRDIGGEEDSEIGKLEYSIWLRVICHHGYLYVIYIFLRQCIDV